MTIEIEIKSPDAFNDIYELRNLIQEAEVAGLQIKLKEQAPIEGTMSGGFLAVAGIVGAVIGETALKASLEIVFHHTIKSLEPAFKKFFEKLHLLGKPGVEIYTEMGDGNLKKSYVTNSDGETTLLNRPNFAIDVQRTKVILIGNSEFDFNFPAIKPVKGNLEDFYNLLIDKKITGIPPENIIVLLNKSSGEIEEQLLLASKLPNVETLLIYYAGHGCRTDKSKLYLVAKNTKKIDDHIISGIDFDFIKNVILKQSTAAQKILILDACHSGIATQGAGDMLAGFNVAGTYTFASSSPDEVSFYHPEKNNTFFTGEIINVLKNGLDNNKENIALNDIYETVTSNLKEKNFPEPHFKSELTIKPSDFYIAHNPKFSAEAWIQKAANLHRMGRLDEALHEYYLLTQRFPEDNSLKEALEDCTKDKKFITLVHEADELFKQKAYEQSLNKYDEALLIKNDFTTRQNRNKCEQYFEIWKQFSEVPGNKTGEVTAAQKIAEGKNEAEIKAEAGDEKKEEPPGKIEPVKPEEKIQPKEITIPGGQKERLDNLQKEEGKQKQWYVAAIIHLLLFGTGLFYVNPLLKRKWVYPLCIFYFAILVLLANSGVKTINRDETYFFRVTIFGALFVGYFIGLIDVINNVVNKGTRQQKEHIPVSTPPAFKNWSYLFCGVIALYYILLLRVMAKSLYDVFNCNSCPFYFNIQQAAFLFLVPLQVLLFVTMRKAGWIISLFTSVIQIAASLWVVLMRGSYYSHAINFSVPVACMVVLAFGAFTIFLFQKKTIQYFKITNRELIGTLIISGIIAIGYYNYLTSVMVT